MPTVGQTVILTAVAQQAMAMPEGEDLATLGRSGALIVLHLAARYVSRVVEEFLPHCGAACPAAVVAYASRPEELIIRGRLGEIAERVKGGGCAAHGCDHGRPNAWCAGVPGQPPVLAGTGPARLLIHVRSLCQGSPLLVRKGHDVQWTTVTRGRLRAVRSRGMVAGPAYHVN
ncbi:putative precorrin-4 C11-methyltransferase [Streptomyces scabiei 87.22]|uniref:Putative precorrin-4 C11-methyltransferase n=1 Tax=Streptomyces scabiei (strain 87.22) TaxID=680198 RepID=C9Z9U3_STRSW|nr:putative precorrin-4 C11-methyltransferase [Streptomyces scabiei 87.22]